MAQLGLDFYFYSAGLTEDHLDAIRRGDVSGSSACWGWWNPCRGPGRWRNL